jgi:hypothetical protein
VYNPLPYVLKRGMLQQRGVAAQTARQAALCLVLHVRAAVYCPGPAKGKGSLVPVVAVSHWGPVDPVVLKPYVPEPKAEKAADDLHDLDPERAPELVDAQIEAEQAMGEGEAEQAMDEGEAEEAMDEAKVSEESIDEEAMDEESDGDVDSDNLSVIRHRQHVMATSSLTLTLTLTGQTA